METFVTQLSTAATAFQGDAMEVAGIGIGIGIAIWGIRKLFRLFKSF